ASTPRTGPTSYYRTTVTVTVPRRRGGRWPGPRASWAGGNQSGFDDRVRAELHDGPGRLGDRAGQRRVDRERVRELVHGQVLLDGDRQQQDQVPGPGGADHAPEYPPAAVPGEDLDEAVADAAHLGPGVGRQGQVDHPGLDL